MCIIKYSQVAQADPKDVLKKELLKKVTTVTSMIADLAIVPLSAELGPQTQVRGDHLHALAAITMATTMRCVQCVQPTMAMATATTPMIATATISRLTR